ESYFKSMNCIRSVLFSIFLVFGFISPTNAQRLVSGYVLDQSTGEALSGATVTPYPSSDTSSQIGTQTNLIGYFELTVPENIQHIDVRFVGYSQRRVRLADITRDLVIELKPGTLVLEGVTISAFEGRRSLLETAGAVA